MKDLLGREIQVNNHICYALTAGRSANLAVYQVKEVQGDKIKANKITESYGTTWGLTLRDGKVVPRRYCKFVYNPGGDSYYEEISDEAKFKVDNKTSTLSMPERVFILDGFVPELLTNNTK